MDIGFKLTVDKSPLRIFSKEVFLEKKERKNEHKHEKAMKISKGIDSQPLYLKFANSKGGIERSRCGRSDLSTQR